MFLEPHGQWRYSLSIFIQQILKNFHLSISLYFIQMDSKEQSNQKTIEKSYLPYDHELLSKKGIKNR